MTAKHPSRTMTEQDAKSSAEAAAAAPPPPLERTFESLVREEIPIQRASIAMQGGAPSCVTLFDNFFLCYSLPNQAKAVYRYGTPKDCSAKWDDFKFCMSIKGLSESQREEVWIKRRAEWWARRRLDKSSEDVWDARKNVYASS